MFLFTLRTDQLCDIVLLEMVLWASSSVLLMFWVAGNIFSL